MSLLKPLMEKNFLEYASYVILDRAIPDLRDGCKPVQRRILHTLFEMHDGKFHKVANVIGECMKLHPHGDASIGDALVVLANKDYFIEKQGNFGNILTGHSAAALPLHRVPAHAAGGGDAVQHGPHGVHPELRRAAQEPRELPAKVPVLLMLGAEGIAVGMSTTILPHNFIELLQAQIAILKDEDYTLAPDFIQGGFIDVSRVRRRPGKDPRARADREGVRGAEARHPRRAVLHHHHEPDRLHRDGGAEGQGERQHHQRLHHGQGGDRAAPLPRAPPRRR